MEVVKNKPVWLDENHPNYERWKRGRDISIQRGEFVKSVVEKVILPKRLHILDLGSGEGGTSRVFSEENFVVSFDLNRDRLYRQNIINRKFKRVSGDAWRLPFCPASFDLIILQDVIEHLAEHKILFEKLRRILKKNGVIFLSTPNRLSLLNILADPHWGLPFLAFFKRETIRRYFLKFFRKNEITLNDIAELLSLNNILKLFPNDFDSTLFTKHSVKKLFEGNKGIVWSDFHLKLIRVAKKIRADKLFIKFANDDLGFINKYLTPTFYILFKKNSSSN